MPAPDITALLARAEDYERRAGIAPDPHADGRAYAQDHAQAEDDAFTAIALRAQAADMARKRKADLSAIHAQAKAQGVDEDTRRAMIERISTGRTHTSAELTAPERAALLRELGGKRKPRRAGRAPSPAAMDHQTMLTRVEQLLTVLRLPWSYAEAILRRQRGIPDKAIACPMAQSSPTELRAVIAALDTRRRKLAAQSRSLPTDAAAVED